ncbi:SDR family oxidoreductase [Amycolatopsis australiensis]|uniref:NAD(P)-dependent dehydrogenase, short-chain alcohol dehydrogenase family n=1 Tax=Amycolatopsis australiensis TaxID=546364 RepID=A0A1K1T2R2_9PSEU|nr:SDR family oxidoreductase [Amycolatopsis australiensis]SFW90796.1 NAD(P)-dependent dehydrogenase, short-chain alcohol dehydrogenase family [Amycolatopsis australiensis]
MKLAAKTAVVTGGSTGIGLAIAKRFAAEGAHVFVTGRRKEALDDAVAEIGGEVTAVQADSANLADLDVLYRAVGERGRGLDVVVANSGGGVFAPLGEITEEQFDATFGTNVKGVLFAVQKALPLLNENASIILTGSTTSTRVSPAFSVYAATKAAVRNFARSWALDLQGTGTRVNVLSPGPTLTPGLLGLVPDDGQQALVDGLRAQVPLGRLGDPAEIAAAALFLASDEASFVNGVEFFVDGGQAQV